MSDQQVERRQAERRYALNFLDYEIISETGEVIGRGLARTLNVSEAGLRLETGQSFEPGQLLRITLGLDNDLVQVTGRVSNSRPAGEDLSASGLMFVEFDEADRGTYRKHFESLQGAVEK